MAQLAMTFLGSFHVTLDGHTVSRFGTDKTRALLAYLALESERAHPREALAGMLWPDQAGDAARHSLRQALLRLRGAIGDTASTAFLLISPETLAFNRASAYSLDAADFAGCVDACHRHTHTALAECAECIARLRQAVELYRGELLHDLFISESTQFEEWVLVRRELLHRQILESLDALTTYHLARGEHTRAREYAARQIELEPWREEAHRALMDAFARDGQRGAALAQYDTCRKILAREFNAAPSEETTRLREEIRAGAHAPLPVLPDSVNIGALAALAQFHLAQGDLARAQAEQIQVLEYQRAAGDKYLLAAAHQQLGNILAQQQDWAHALAHLCDALALREQIRDRGGMAESLDARAHVLAQQGDLGAAQSDARRALKIRKTMGDPVGCARSLTHLGTLCQRQKKFADARACWERALALQKKIGNRAAVADLEKRLEACRDSN